MNRNNVEKLVETARKEGCRADLRSADLRGAYLRSADLSGAYLYWRWRDGKKLRAKYLGVMR
jgi:uncharacterized protein YjbI with pentapeptide repeats